MKKLTLNVDALRVESFAPTGNGRGDRGTVRGNAVTEEAGCTEYESCIGTCETCYTWNYTCDAQERTCAAFTCGYDPFCAYTYGVTCPVECRTQGIIC